MLGEVMISSAFLSLGIVLTFTGADAADSSSSSRPLTSAEEQKLQPKDEFQECANCPRMVVVPAGEFQMGTAASETDALIKEYGEDSKDSRVSKLFEKWLRPEKPQHKVFIPKSFAVGKFEVTFAEWDACVSDGGCKHKPETAWGRERQPVMNVSWDDITKEYLPWLRKKTGKEYRLLSEAEWEYAARAETTTAYSTGSSITKKQAQFSEGSLASAGKTVEVGSFPANAFSLHDMHGNVWELVEDCWNENYDGASTDGSVRTTGECGRRVLRGGSWDYLPRYLRSAIRVRYTSDFRDYCSGFRLARTLSH